MADKTNPRVEAIRKGLDAATQSYFMPKLREARMSAAQSRGDVRRLAVELSEITPEAVLNGMVEGWDRELERMDNESQRVEESAARGES